jgi:hypothetical protein
MHVVFEPLEFVAKLAALVPPPMFNFVRYHGILSPAARWRSSIVPSAHEEDPVHNDGCSAGKQHAFNLLAKILSPATSSSR